MGTFWHLLGVEHLRKAGRIEEKKDTSKSSYAQLAKAITKAVKSSLKKSGKKRKHHSDTSDSSDSE